jgi:hypothetical protein
MMTGVRRISLLVVVALGLAACGAGGAAPSDSGVKGRVLIGPMCPVVQEGVPCPDAPFEATIKVRKVSSGKVVAKVRSGRDGRFRVNLGAGRYLLEPVSPNGGAPPYAGPIEVRVRAHQFTRVTITYDSGIR